jgi:hypothetical protein
MLLADNDSNDTNDANDVNNADRVVVGLGFEQKFLPNPWV